MSDIVMIVGLFMCCEGTTSGSLALDEQLESLSDLSNVLSSKADVNSSSLVLLFTFLEVAEVSELMSLCLFVL
jgi:hypothetical protein